LLPAVTIGFTQALGPDGKAVIRAMAESDLIDDLFWTVHWCLRLKHSAAAPMLKGPRDKKAWIAG